MHDITLLVMAAGIGSRYGAGIKQLEPIDRFGHIIIDYSVYDAIRAGFNKIIFVIRKEIEKDFREEVGTRIEKNCRDHGVDVLYAYQDLNDVPCLNTFSERKKPWGTGQAVLAAKDDLTEPFAVINADDYYGRKSFSLLHEWLTEEHPENEICMVGYVLKNTLSNHGGVTRGVCMTRNGYLSDIVETKDITNVDGAICSADKILDPESCVSMNMWGFQPSFLDELQKGWRSFFNEDVFADPLTAEYLLPNFIGKQVRRGCLLARVLETDDRWFGITYQEDKPEARAQFETLIDSGKYCF